MMIVDIVHLEKGEELPLFGGEAHGDIAAAVEESLVTVAAVVGPRRGGGLVGLNTIKAIGLGPRFLTLLCLSTKHGARFNMVLGSIDRF